MSESTEQMKVVEWCKTTDYLSGGKLGIGKILHIPNGGYRSKSEAAQLKALGVKAGVSDLFLPVMAQGRGGLWIEMKKAATGRVSPEQTAFGEAMLAAGYGFVVAFGSDQAIQSIKDYLGIEP